MSLVARHLESIGIPTVVVGSARDIVEECGVTRFLFVDYPLGNTAGRPHQLDEQIQIAPAALRLAETATEPGRIETLPYTWPGEWKAKARELSDNRTPRHDPPQYERAEDETAAIERSRG